MVQHIGGESDVFVELDGLIVRLPFLFFKIFQVGYEPAGINLSCLFAGFAGAYSFVYGGFIITKY